MLGETDSSQTDALEAPADRFLPAGIDYTLIHQFNNLLRAQATGPAYLGEAQFHVFFQQVTG
jgi:hypothetical protein